VVFLPQCSKKLYGRLGVLKEIVTVGVAFCSISLLVAAASAQHESVLQARVFKNKRGGTMPYRLFVPKNYDGHFEYPLVLYLHGGGGLGTDNLKQIQTGNAITLGMFLEPQNQSKYPCLILAPQSHDEGWVEADHKTPSPQLDLALELVESLIAEYHIDRHRLYVIGQSLGGFGTFALISKRPGLFAAAVPICGGGDESRAARIARMPVWAFHGAKDGAVNVELSRRMIAAMQKAGGTPRYTEYPDDGHVVWPRVIREPELLSWLFSQRVN